MIIHNIPPVYDENSNILILGSFPSVKSREQGFFYGHPQNRFWDVISFCYQEQKPITIEEKKYFLLKNHIALWDVIGQCDITGSSDASIQNAMPNNISEILSRAKIKAIFVNGKTAEKYYKKYLQQKLCMTAICLPSTSPANATCKIDTLKNIWSRALLPRFLGETVHIEIDRPIGYVHQKNGATITYPINYGYVPGILGGDEEELDVYLLDEKKTITNALVKVIGIVRRRNDVEDKLVATSYNTLYTRADIEKIIYFQESRYDSHVELLEDYLPSNR